MRYNPDTCAVELTVDELCAIAHKGGHLDARHPRRMPRPTDQSKLKLPVEKDRRASVLLRNTLTHNGITYTVEGVADAVCGEDLVEQIKVSKKGSANTRDGFSRLRALGYMLAAAKNLGTVRVRMRHYNPEGNEVKDIVTSHTCEELCIFYLSMISRIEPLARDLVHSAEERLATARALRFPYPNPREGQTELAERAFRAIRRGERLFAEAPTGIGKTMSTLYPAVKALGEGYCDRIFYLTAKASVRREAFSAAAKLHEVGSRLRTVMLYAKEQMCAHPEGCRAGASSRCNPDACPFARGYYDRVDGAIAELLATRHGFPKSILCEVAQKHRVCPYELSLDLSERCEIIICDYNYAFAPDVYLRRYFDAQEGERGEYVFLVDEAHNLPDRARDMYSVQLGVAPFEAVYAKLDPGEDSELEGVLGGYLMSMRRLGAFCTEHREKHEDGTESGYYLNRAPLLNFTEETLQCRRALDAFLKKNEQHPLATELAELSALLRRFCGLSDYYDDRFLTYIRLQQGEIFVQLYCLDPAGVLHSAMGRARASVLFSATLKPLDYFVDILGGKGADTVELPSPYDPARLCVTVASGVSTRMEDRAKSYRRIATLIAATVSARAGNYMVYFPSYDYMEHVHEQFAAKYPGVCCVLQKRGMSQRAQEEFLAAFKADEGKLRVGFCVLGGSFSEGVDLPGSRLIGVVVVGTGIPGLSDERNMLRDYYENKCERGYDYAYTYPGMNHVLQAAGRVIRREEDKGVVVLIDDRYAAEPYLHLYPTHWQGIAAAGDAKALAHRCKTFWSKEI